MSKELFTLVYTDISDFLENVSSDYLKKTRKIFDAYSAPFSNVKFEDLIEKDLNISIYQKINGVSIVFSGSINIDTLKEKIRDSLKNEPIMIPMNSFDVRRPIRIEVHL